MRLTTRRVATPSVNELGHRVIRLGTDRYDLFVERHGSSKESAELVTNIVHVPDLLAGGSPKAMKIGRREPDSRIVAIPLFCEGPIAGAGFTMLRSQRAKRLDARR